MIFSLIFEFLNLRERDDPLLWLILFLWIIRRGTFARVGKDLRGRFLTLLRAYRLFGVTDFEKLELVSFLK